MTMRLVHKPIRQPVNRWLACGVCTLAAAFYFNPAIGAEAEPDPPKEPAEVVKDDPAEESAAKKVTTGKPKKDKKNDVFLPTERISEDYSVAFPADI